MLLRRHFLRWCRGHFDKKILSFVKLFKQFLMNLENKYVWTELTFQTRCWWKPFNCARVWIVLTERDRNANLYARVLLLVQITTMNVHKHCIATANAVCVLRIAWYQIRAQVRSISIDKCQVRAQQLRVYLTTLHAIVLYV